MTNKTKAIIALAVAPLCAACNYVLIKSMQKTLSPLTMSYLRVGIGVIILLLFFRPHISFRRLFQASKKQWFLFFITGVFGYGLYAYFSTTAVTKTLVVNVTFIEACLPIVIYFYSIFLLKEKVNLNRVLLAVLSIYGALIIATKSFLPMLSQFKLGELFALLDTIMLALSFVGRKMLGKDFNTLELSFVSLLFAFVSLVGIAEVTGNRVALSEFTLPIVISTVLTGLFLTLSVVLTNYGLKYVSPTLGGQLNLMKIVFAFILSFIFFMEVPNIYSIVGGTLIVTGVYISQKYFS